ncbi:unnamed protein product, partial [Ectocarpus sp. 4 AP-2014]
MGWLRMARKKRNKYMNGSFGHSVPFIAEYPSMTVLLFWVTVVCWTQTGHHERCVYFKVNGHTGISFRYTVRYFFTGTNHAGKTRHLLLYLFVIAYGVAVVHVVAANTLHYVDIETKQHGRDVRKRTVMKYRPGRQHA